MALLLMKNNQLPTFTLGRDARCPKCNHYNAMIAEAGPEIDGRPVYLMGEFFRCRDCKFEAIRETAPAAQANADDLESFSFEIYTKNPETGETGWDIKNVVAFGVTKNDAIEILRRDVPNFDCVITATASWNGTKLTDNERRHFEAGNSWYNTDNELVN